MSDIVITGIGVITPIGVGREIFWKNLRQAKSGLKKITSFDTSPFHSNVAGVVNDFDPSRYMPPKTYRRMSLISRMAVAASQEALEDSGIILEDMNRERLAVIMGTAYGSSAHVEDFYVSLLREGPRGAQPFLFPETVPNAPASHIAMVHNIAGPNSTFCQNELSAENAMLYARNLLQQGQIDVAVVGGAEELSRMLYSCYEAVGALNRIKVEAGEPILPQPGDGLILGEGAGILIMERIEHALDRGARIYGRLKSGTITGGVTPIGHYEPQGTHMADAMLQAIRDAGIRPNEIDQIDVSANFTNELDCTEYARIKEIFENRNNLELTPLKYLMGDFGGAGIIRASAILLSLSKKLPLPTVKADVLKGDSIAPIQWHIRPTTEMNATLMTSSTFGGGSAALVFVKK